MVDGGQGLVVEETLTLPGDQYSYHDIDVRPDQLYSYELFGVTAGGDVQSVGYVDAYTFAGGGW
jgi:hypothetical protein